MALIKTRIITIENQHFPMSQAKLFIVDVIMNGVPDRTFFMVGISTALVDLMILFK